MSASDAAADSSRPSATATPVCVCVRCVSLRREVAALTAMLAHSHSAAFQKVHDAAVEHLERHAAALRSEWMLDPARYTDVFAPTPMLKFMLTGEVPDITHAFAGSADDDASMDTENVTLEHSAVAADAHALPRPRDLGTGSVAVGIRAPLFIVGCGRSGTTLLTRMFGCHPRVVDINEARALWLAACPRLDVWSVAAAARGGTLSYSHSPGSQLTPDELCKLRALFTQALARSPKVQNVSGQSLDSWLLVEKLPENAFRLSLLRALFPDCRIIHLVRHQSAVAASIAKFSTDAWYGPTDYKWTQVSQCFAELMASRGATIDASATSLGRLAAATHSISNMRDRGAIEWYAAVCTVREDAFRLGMLPEHPPRPPTDGLPPTVQALLPPSPAEEAVPALRASSGSYMELNFDDLVLEPSGTWGRIAAFAGLPHADSDVPDVGGATPDQQTAARFAELFASIRPEKAGVAR